MSDLTLPSAFEIAALDTFDVTALATDLMAVAAVVTPGPGTGMAKAGATAMRVMIVFLTSMMVIVNGR